MARGVFTLRRVRVAARQSSCANPGARLCFQDPHRGSTIVLTAVAGACTWNVLDGHWTFADGTTADGTTVTLPQKHLGGSVTITDGAGKTATTGVHVS